MDRLKRPSSVVLKAAVLVLFCALGLLVTVVVDHRQRLDSAQKHWEAYTRCLLFYGELRHDEDISQYLHRIEHALGPARSKLAPLWPATCTASLKDAKLALLSADLDVEHATFGAFLRELDRFIATYDIALELQHSDLKPMLAKNETGQSDIGALFATARAAGMPEPMKPVAQTAHSEGVRLFKLGGSLHELTSQRGLPYPSGADMLDKGNVPTPWRLPLLKGDLFKRNVLFGVAPAAVLDNPRDAKLACQVSSFDEEGMACAVMRQYNYSDHFLPQTNLTNPSVLWISEDAGRSVLPSDFRFVQTGNRAQKLFNGKGFAFDSAAFLLQRYDDRVELHTAEALVTEVPISPQPSPMELRGDLVLWSAQKEGEPNDLRVGRIGEDGAFWGWQELGALPSGSVDSTSHAVCFDGEHRTVAWWNERALVAGFHSGRENSAWTQTLFNLRGLGSETQSNASTPEAVSSRMMVSCDADMLYFSWIDARGTHQLACSDGGCAVRHTRWRPPSATFIEVVSRGDRVFVVWKAAYISPLLGPTEDVRIRYGDWEGIQTQSDIVISPHIQEPWGDVVLQAGSYGENVYVFLTTTEETHHLIHTML